MIIIEKADYPVKETKITCTADREFCGNGIELRLTKRGIFVSGSFFAGQGYLPGGMISWDEFDTLSGEVRNGKRQGTAERP